MSRPTRLRRQRLAARDHPKPRFLIACFRASLPGYADHWSHPSPAGCLLMRPSVTRRRRFADWGTLGSYSRQM